MLPVQTVLSMRNPSTIVWAVVTSIVNSIEFKIRTVPVSDRPIIKAKEIVPPFITHGLSLSTVPLPLGRVLVETTVLHIGPPSVKMGVPQPVSTTFKKWLTTFRKATLLGRLKTGTTTALRMAGRELTRLYYCILTAHAQAFPVSFLLSGIREKGYHFQTFEALTFKV